MGNEKWTAGPWSADGRYVRAPDGAEVAEAWSGIPGNKATDGSIRSKAMVANARLIAAAPDMAEALASALLVLEIPHTATAEYHRAAVVAAARAALAKARGER